MNKEEQLLQIIEKVKYELELIRILGLKEDKAERARVALYELEQAMKKIK